MHADAGVRHILQLNKPAGRALIEFHQALLRGDSPLSAAQLDEGYAPLLKLLR